MTNISISNIMKAILIILLICTIPLQGISQTKSIKKFFNKYKHSENTIKLNLPGFLFKIGSRIAKKHVESEEDKFAVDQIKKIKRSRILVMEDENQIDPDDLIKLRENVKGEGFSDLVDIRTQDVKVSIMIEENNDIVENILLLVNEENTFVMVAMKTKLSMKDVNQLIKNALRSNVLKEKEKKEELPPKEKPVKKPVKPRV